MQTLPHLLSRACGLILTVLLVTISSAQAAEPSERAVDNAHEFLKTETTGKYVTAITHPGATYQKHHLVGLRPVRDEAGMSRPDQFAIVYQFHWELQGAGTTTLGFICDNRSGTVEEVVGVEPDAIQQQPFLGESVTIQHVGISMIVALKEGMSANDLKQALCQLVENDTRRLLGTCLRLKQLLNL